MVDVQQTNPVDRLIKKDALVELLKKMVKQGINVDMVFLNAKKYHQLEGCKSERSFWRVTPWSMVYQ